MGIDEVRLPQGEAQECIGHVQCAQINAKMAARTRRHQKNDKRAETAQLTYWHKTLDGLGNHADVSTARMDMQSDGNNSKTAKNMSRKVRTSQGPKTHLESLKLKCPSVPKDRNMLTLTGMTCTHRGTGWIIDAHDTSNIMIALGGTVGVMGRSKDFAASVEAEEAGASRQHYRRQQRQLATSGSSAPASAT